MLQGGIEDRFIPGLSEPTKLQIEGSFKITGDKELQRLSLADASTIMSNSEDNVLNGIINGGVHQLSGEIKLVLDVLV